MSFIALAITFLLALFVPQETFAKGNEVTTGYVDSANVNRVSFESVMVALQSEKKKRAAERSLLEFCRQAWPIIEPGVPFKEGWHLRALCEHLEAVTNGQIKRLLINIPPRTSKSTIVSVMWPCWEWIKRPYEKYLCASYSGTLSTRDNVSARRIIQSDWYKKNWGDTVKLTGDQNQKTRFENSFSGYRIATSVGGSATGEGGSRLVIDDPHSATDAQSDTIRPSQVEWFRMTMSSRLNTPKEDAIVVIMQRLHEEDVAGYILSQGGYEHLCLPMRYELDSKGKRRTTVLGDYDVRQKEGELLMPSRFGDAEVEFLEKELGQYGAAGQLQQRPAPAGGGILKTSHIQLWPNNREIPQIEYILQSYDTAFTEDVDNDYTANVTLGVFFNVYEQKMCVLILDAWNDHLAYPSLRKKVIADWGAYYGGNDKGRKGKRADDILVEEKASGISLLQDLIIANVPAKRYNPGRLSKANRAHLSAPILELDLIYVLESSKRPGEPISWVKPLITQMSIFPASKKKDYVDAFSQGILYIKESRFLELPVHEDDEPVYYKKPVKNPYDA
jgi:hypothetical protein